MGRVETRRGVETHFDDHGNMFRQTYKSSGTTKTYFGTKGDERLAEMWVPRDKIHKYYEGVKGKERMTMVADTASDTNYLYLGSRGQERLDRVRHPNGMVDYYCGKRDSPQVVYTKHEDDENSDDDIPNENEDNEVQRPRPKKHTPSPIESLHSLADAHFKIREKISESEYLALCKFTQAVFASVSAL